MRRRNFIGRIGSLNILLAATVANAQTDPRRFLIGHLLGGTQESYASNIQAFSEGLVELGFVEGRNLVVERRFAGGRPEILPSLAGELVRLQPKVIAANGNTDINALMRATDSIPIVMIAAQDPVGAGFVTSLSRPTGNVTGLSAVAGTEIRGKRLQFLKELVPGLNQVVVLRVTGESAPSLSAALETAAKALSLTLAVVEIRTVEDLPHAFASILALQPKALFVDGGSVITQGTQAICEFALQNRIAATYGTKEYAHAGLLVTYGFSVNANFRRAASYVAKILRGAKPSDLPIEQPTRFEMTINLKTAKAIGVKVPQSFLLRADEVIQ